MNADFKANDSRVKICGAVILLGAAICSISLFTLVRYAFKGESPYSFAFLLRNLACIAGYLVISVGIFTEKHHLFKLGLFIAATAFIIDAYFPLMWIDSNRKYYGSLSEAFGDGNLVLLLCYLAALAGFVFMGILFSQKKEWQFSGVGSIAIICIVGYAVLALGYTIYYINENYLTLSEYVSSYIPSSSLLSMVGAIGVLLMPFIFADEIPKVEILEMIKGNQKKTQASQSAVSELTIPKAAESGSPKMLEEDTVNLLRRYKQLLDMGIINDEEFQQKKSELLR